MGGLRIWTASGPSPTSTAFCCSRTVPRASAPGSGGKWRGQLNGRTADMDRFRSIADQHGVLLLEDSAQGIGSRFRGKMAGSFGLAGVLSFYPAKVLGCLGDGGAVLTNDEA